MSEPEEAEDERPRGHISREYTVWCGECCFWEQWACKTKAAAGETARHNGWKDSVSRGWLCPDCASRKPSQTGQG